MTKDLRDRLQTSLGTSHTIERELGGGGMSRVFVALEHALGRRVVIKTLPDDTALATSAADRFRREILTAASIEHANIVPVLAAGDAAGTPYFVMPWVDGESLRQRMARGAIPPGEALSILRDVARALAAAHAHNVVHRDIKPENILLAGGAARVTDFGVAKALSAATDSDGSRAGMTGVGISIGTPAYMAPEQLAADPSLDHRADIYAWGLVAYEMLSGGHPYSGLSGASLMQAQLATVPPSLALRAPGTSAAVAALIARALAKDPKDRPQTAARLIDELDALSSTPAGASLTPPRSRYRVAAVAAVLVVAAGAFALWRTTSLGADVDERVIAVAPFGVNGASPSLQYLREGIADLMVPQLASIEGVKPTSSRQMFDSWRREAGSMDAELTDERARDAAGLIGAGQVILGSIAGNEQRLIMNAGLIRVSDGSSIVSDTVVGPIDSLFPMTARLTAKLLAIRGGASRERLASIMSAQPAAITSFLNGERLYRRGRYLDAARQFADAYKIDTTFALASLRISSSNGWIPTSPIPGPWLARAHAHRGRLTGTDSLLLVALVGTAYPTPMPQREYLEQRWALAARSSSAELWHLAADGLYHGGFEAAIPDAMVRALDGFKKAEAIDSSYAGGLEHQSMLYLSFGDTANARDADRRQARIDSTGDFFVVAHTIVKVTFANPEERAEIARRMLTETPETAPFIAAWVASGQDAAEPDLTLAEQVFTSPLARKHANGSFLGLMLRDTYLNTGRVAELSRVFPPDSSPTGKARQMLEAMLWDGDTVQAARAAADIDRWRPTVSDTTGTSSINLPRLARALWAIERRDTLTARRVREELRQYRAPPETPWTGNTTELYGKMLDARLAVAAKASNAKSLLAELDSLLIDMPRIERRDGRVIGNVLIAGMWEEVGEPRRALEATRRRDMQYAYAAYTSTQLRLRARAAEAAGEREEAIRALRSYVALRAHADPALQADVESARQNLARLESLSRGR